MDFKRILSTLIGVLLCGLGIYYFVVPDVGIRHLVTIFSILFLIRGISTLTLFIKSERTLFVLISGLFDTILGIIFIVYPIFIASVISLFLAFWILFTGIIEIAKALDCKKQEDKGWFLRVLLGIICIIATFMIINNKQLVTHFTLYMVASILILLGISNIATGLFPQLKKDNK